MRKIGTTLAAMAGAAVLVAATPANAAPAASNSASGGVATLSRPMPSNVTASAAVGFRIYNARCTANTVKFTAQTYETGRSGVQQFRQQAQLQRWNGSRWVAATPIKNIRSTKFPNDARSFSFTLNWTGTHPAGGSWREAWRGFYLNGAGRTIAQTRVIFITCL